MLSEGYIEEIANREEHMSRASIQLGDFFNQLPELENVLSPELFPTVLWGEIHGRSNEFSCGIHGVKGALFQLATEMCPSLAKSHLKLAQWAFEMARIENSPSANLFSVYQFGETPEENESLWKCLEMTSHAQFEKAVRNTVSDLNRVTYVVYSCLFRIIHIID